MRAICIGRRSRNSEMPLFAAFNNGLTGYRSAVPGIKPGRCKTIRGSIRCVNTRVDPRASDTRYRRDHTRAYISANACVTSRPHCTYHRHAITASRGQRLFVEGRVTRDRIFRARSKFVCHNASFESSDSREYCFTKQSRPFEINTDRFAR